VTKRPKFQGLEKWGEKRCKVVWSDVR
jgi:hypothetical protein